MGRDRAPSNDDEFWTWTEVIREGTLGWEIAFPICYCGFVQLEDVDECPRCGRSFVPVSAQ
jgi:hypothetical protein